MADCNIDCQIAKFSGYTVFCLAHQPYHSDQDGLCLRHMLRGYLQRQEMVVASSPTSSLLLLGHHAPAVGPYLRLGYLAVLLREETANRDLPPSQHTLTPHNTRGRGFVIYDVVIVVSPRAFIFLISSVTSIFKVPESYRATNILIRHHIIIVITKLKKYMALKQSKFYQY